MFWNTNIMRELQMQNARIDMYVVSSLKTHIREMQTSSPHHSTQGFFCCDALSPHFTSHRQQCMDHGVIDVDNNVRQTSSSKQQKLFLISHTTCCLSLSQSFTHIITHAHLFVVATQVLNCHFDRYEVQFESIMWGKDISTSQKTLLKISFY